jgi:predicted NBD/HSP70 family sugar kinase
VRSVGLLDAKVIGISCAGFVEADRKVRLFRVGGWNDRDIVGELSEQSPSSRIFLLNDAESHLMAHYGTYKAPLMSISLGTSLGFAISDKAGAITRPADGVNYDLGHLTLPTRAGNNRVWWALGSQGLRELQNSLGNDGGVKHFGHRLGAFLANLCSVFRPRTVIVSGGIAEKWWHVFRSTMEKEFNHQKPDWLGPIDIVKSPYGGNAALIGIATYIKHAIKR